MSNTPTAEEFLRALPPVLRNDSRMIALGQVVAEELSDRMSEIEKAAIYPRIDELDEALLDILAYDFKVDWYGYDYPLETKRALLKSSFYIAGSRQQQWCGRCQLAGRKQHQVDGYQCR